LSPAPHGSATGIKRDDQAMANSKQAKPPASTSQAQARPRASRKTSKDADSYLLAPEIETLGHAPFTQQALQALERQLSDPRWPRGTLNLRGLEGFLSALLVLPIGLRPAAWLPLIWKESSWRMPPAIDDAASFARFLEGIVGFMRSIEDQLLARPARIAPSLRGGKEAQACQEWAQGFLLPVGHSDNFRVRPDDISYEALLAIATLANAPRETSYPWLKAMQTLERSVLALSMRRKSRGPLGGL
jgi:yecA family protein